MPAPRRMGITNLRTPWTLMKGPPRGRERERRRHQSWRSERGPLNAGDAGDKGPVVGWILHGSRGGKKRLPAGVACKGCSGRKQKCFLPELSKEWAALKPASKRKREEGEQARGDREDERRASGSGAKAGGTGERGDEAPKKKQKVEVVPPP